MRTERKLAKKEYIQARMNVREHSLCDADQIQSLVTDMVNLVVQENGNDKQKPEENLHPCSKLPISMMKTTAKSNITLKSKSTHNSWLHRAHVIFMWLHPKIYNRKTATVSAELGISEGTFRGWVSTQSKHSYVHIWYDIVGKLTWNDMKKHFGEHVTKKFDEHVGDSEKVCLKFYEKFRSDYVVLTEKSGLAKRKRACLANQTNQALKRGEEPSKGKFINVNRDKKRVDGIRNGKYQEETNLVVKHVINMWHNGNPATRSGCITVLRNYGSRKSEFYTKYLDPKKQHQDQLLSTWLSRILKSIGFSVRKNTISQTVPTNWKQLSEEFAKFTFDLLTENGVKVIVNADQTFVNFRCAKEKLLVPTGSTRVGSNVELDDEKKGITCMVTVSISPKYGSIVSQMHPPFMVFGWSKRKDS